MGFGVHIRIDTEGDIGGDPERFGLLLHAVEFLRVFEIKAPDAGGQSRTDFLPRFADTGINDFFGSNACSETPGEFSAAHNIKAETQAVKKTENGERGAGLDGKKDAVVRPFDAVKPVSGGGF